MTRVNPFNTGRYITVNNSLYVGTGPLPDDAVEGTLYYDLETDPPETMVRVGEGWISLTNPEREDDMKKIRVLKPKYAQSRYPTKSERRRTREEGLREQREGLKSEVEVLKAKLSALEPDPESLSRLPNPSSRKMRF